MLLLLLLVFLFYHYHYYSYYYYYYSPGTTSITPFAAFKVRGAWRGAPIEWDPKVGSEEIRAT